MRSLRSLPMLLLMLVSLGVTARADSITTFTLSGASAPLASGTLPGTPVSGTITIDTTKGIVDAVNFNEPVYNFPYLSTLVLYASPGYPFVEVAEEWGKLEPEFINLYIPVTTLVGYTGGSLCSLDTPCEDSVVSSTGQIRNNDFIYGELTPTVTPEPSSMTLLAIGSLALLSLPGVAKGLRRGAM